MKIIISVLGKTENVKTAGEFMENFQFRYANESDVSLILEFIKGLAEYEKMSDEVIATEELLKEWIFERKCGRLEWWCLDWNQPSIDFYLSLGAEAMDEWTVYRIAGEKLTEFAK